MSAALTSSTFVGAKVSVAKTTTVSKRAAFSVQANASGPKRVRIPISFFFSFFCTLKNLQHRVRCESKEGRKCQIVTEKNNLEISCERIRRDARVLGSIDRRSFERESISRVQSRVSLRGSSASARPRATDFDSLFIYFFS